jgi:alpha-D-ribose 1-methylphosphonate 5-triphosphate synthase subunit PhnH
MVQTPGMDHFWLVVLEIYISKLGAFFPNTCAVPKSSFTLILSVNDVPRNII